MTRILVVEDEVKIAQLLSDYLIQAQFSAEMLHDGSTVVEAVKSDRYDMVLLDLMLPVKDGLTLCKELRAFSNIPIIMITARVEEIDRWHRARGFREFGYHWLVDRDGKMKSGRSETTNAAACPGYNTNAIHICLLGGYKGNRKQSFLDNFTVEQEDSLKALVKELQDEYVIADSKLLGHHEVDNGKECPCFDVQTLVKKWNKEDERKRFRKINKQERPF
mgnify:CR=1 FL=1